MLIDRSAAGAVGPLLRPTAAAFRQLARVRGARALHPHGVVLTGRLHLTVQVAGPGTRQPGDDADLRLDPADAPPGLELPRRFGPWREAAYRGSHAGWPAD